MMRMVGWLVSVLPVWMIRLITFWALSLNWRSVTAQRRDAPSITIAQGTLNGVQEYVEPDQRLVFAYRGIPYAAPPVGRLRFKPPAPPSGWNGSQLFDRNGPACPQLDTQGTPEAGTSEDCLTLNIWLPQAPDVYSRLPVLVFLDGELFWRQRASRFPLQQLAAQGLIAVSVSYRTNVFGFLTLGSAAAPGNLGLRDQQLALSWVQQNIAAFGGDPRLVTLAGFSAGAASAGLHMVSPRSQGLFQRVIMMSGSPLAPWAYMNRLEARGTAQELASVLGCRSRGDEETVRCLQEQDFVRLLAATQQILEARGRFYPVLAPVEDAFLSPPLRVLPKSPKDLLRDGNFNKVPVLTGVDADDGLLMLYQYPGTDRLTVSNLTLVLRRVVAPRLLLQQRNLLQQRHLPQQRRLLEGMLNYRYIEAVPPGSQRRLLASFVRIFSDAYFIAPMYAFLELYTRTGAATYVYAFTKTGPDIFGNVVSLQGAGHGSQLLYLLGPEMYRRTVGGTYGLDQRQLGQNLRRYWKRFILEGEPVPGDRWRRFSTSQPNVYDVAEAASLVGYRRESAGFWNDFLPFIAEPATTLAPAVDTDSQQLVGPQPPYQAIMWALIVVMAVLVLGLLVAFLLTRQGRKRRSDMAVG